MRIPAGLTGIETLGRQGEDASRLAEFDCLHYEVMSEQISSIPRTECVGRTRGGSSRESSRRDAPWDDAGESINQILSRHHYRRVVGTAHSASSAHTHQYLDTQQHATMAGLLWSCSVPESLLFLPRVWRASRHPSWKSRCSVGRRMIAALGGPGCRHRSSRYYRWSRCGRGCLRCLQVILVRSGKPQMGIASQSQSCWTSLIPR